MVNDVEVAEALATVATELAKPEETKWEAVKEKAIQLFGSLFMEQDSAGKWKISLGRVSFWLAFVPALYVWISGRGILDDGMAVTDISPNHLTMLLTLAAYNFGKKVSDTVKNVWGNGDGPG